MSKDSFDVTIIGGGPAGGHTASLIAQTGYSVAIVEEHDVIGAPVQCAGLISPRCLDIIGNADDLVLNRLHGADIHSPSGQHMSIGSKSAKAIVIDRAGFDRRILGKAVDSGAELITGKRVKKLSRNAVCQTFIEDRIIKSKLIIGADGAKSAVRRWLGIDKPEFLLYGLSADIAGLDIEQDRTQIFFGKEIAPNFFAWMIPVDDVTRVGLCIREGSGTPNDYFKKLFKSGESAKFLKNARILKTHSGIIPLGMPSRTYSERGMAVGDAACQVKATSGGGLYPGLICARHCAETVIKSLGEDDQSAKSLSRYHEAWREEIGDELDKALMMHRIYASLNDEQLEDIFGMLLNPDILETINNTGDIDYPSKLGWMLLKKEPGLLRYAGKFLRHGLMGR